MLLCENYSDPITWMILTNMCKLDGAYRTLTLQEHLLIERMLNSFWWGQSSIKWLRWEGSCGRKSDGGLGFRQMRQFNIALLAKQGWRLLSQPQALMSRIYKAKYFPRNTFLEASVGGNPSFTWRSIMSAQMLLKSGCRRKIGDGASTSLWKDPWIPDRAAPYVTSNREDRPVDSWVKELISENGGEWNIEKVHGMLNERDAGLVLNIPLSVIRRDDTEEQYCCDTQAATMTAAVTSSTAASVAAVAIMLLI